MSLSSDLKKRREELLNGASSSGSTGLDVLSQRRADLAAGKLKTNTPPPINSVTPSKLPITTPNALPQQNQNIFQKIGSAIGSIFAPKTDKPIDLPNGIKLNFIDNPVTQKPASSTTLSIAGQAPTTQLPAQKTPVKIAGPGITEADIQRQKVAQANLISPFHTGKENVWDTLTPGTAGILKDLGGDPLSLKKAPKVKLTDLLSPFLLVDNPYMKTASNAYIQGIKDALVSDGEAIKQLFAAKSNSAKVGAAESVGARTVGAVLSPITSLFTAANDIPVLGTVSKLISLPFAALGDAGHDLAYGVANSLPISKEARANIVDGTGEIIGLALMIGVGGKIADVPGKVKDTLVKRYGPTDAATIMTKAEEVAQNNEKPSLSGTKSPQEVINFVQDNQIGNTETGKALLKASSDALQTNKYLQIDEPKVAGLLNAKNPVTDGKIAGEGFTMTDSPNVDQVRVGRTLNEYRTAVDSYNKNPTIKSLDRVQNAREAVSSLEKEKMVQIKTPTAPDAVKVTEPQIVRGVEVKPMGQDAIVYRGAQVHDLNTERPNGITGGVSMSTDKSVAERFAKTENGTVQQYTIPKDATVVNHSDLERLTKYVPQSEKAAVSTKFLKDNNVDVVKFDVPNGAKGEAEYRVINKGVFEKPGTSTTLKSTDELLSYIDRQGYRTPEQIRTLRKSIEDFGIKYPIELIHKADGTFEFNDGTHRVQIAHDLGIKELPVKIIEEGKTVGVARDQMPIGKGAEKVSRLEARMKGVFDKATQDQIDQLGLSTFNQMNRKEVIADAARWVSEHTPDEAISVLKGETEAPKGIPPESIYVALAQAAKEDITLGTKLISLQATAMGQRLSLLAELDPFNPVSIGHGIYKFKAEEFAKNHAGKTFAEASKSMIEKGKEKIKAPQLTDWDSFIKEVRC